MTWLLHFSGTDGKEYVVLTDDEVEGDNFDTWRRSGYRLESKTEIVDAPVTLPTEQELTLGNMYESL